jgi:predicted branched-subunit amino acid permease
VLAGAFGGTVVTNTDAFGLDAAFPAVLLALILPAMRDPATRRAAVAGVVIALATATFLPAGLPVLLALVGLLVGLRGLRTRQEVAA